MGLLVAFDCWVFVILMIYPLRCFVLIDVGTCFCFGAWVYPLVCSLVVWFLVFTLLGFVLRGLCLLG